MYPNRLKIDTKVGHNTGASPTSSIKLPTSATRGRSPLPIPKTGNLAINQRTRSVSKNSVASSLSVRSQVTPISNASTSSLQIPEVSENNHIHTHNPSPSPSPTSPVFDETIRLGPDYVLAMHDFSPQQSNATCLSFRAGQVIHVLNRDPSGWWDGELDGRRGWFPSNYVTADVGSLTEEELPNNQTKRGHSQSHSVSSTTSWTTTHEDEPQRAGTLSFGQDIDSYCPDLMVPLLHGLSLLQTAVRANRTTHFAPSTACIISCVRAILSATDTLVRDAPILQRFPPLAQERRQILSVLAALVAQAKKASEDVSDQRQRDVEVEKMLRLGGQVFAHVRRFLGVAVQCGVELPNRRPSNDSTDTEGPSWSNQDMAFDAPSVSCSESASGRTPTQNRHRGRDILATAGTPLRDRTQVGSARRMSTASEDADFMPLLPNRLGEPSKQDKYAVHRHKLTAPSISSVSSSSSISSEEAGPVVPQLPSGPSTSAQVVEALRFTHDQYLSTIAAFIGHVHSHSRASHASSTGYLYDLVTEVVEMVCKLLTIVEAVKHHPDVPPHRLGNLKSAKEGLFNVTSSLAESVHLLTLPLPGDLTEEEEKQNLLKSATNALKAGADCVAAVKICLNRSAGEKPFIITLPSMKDGNEPFSPNKFTRLQLLKSVSFNELLASNPEDHTVTPSSSAQNIREDSSGSDNSSISKSSTRSDETGVTSPDESKPTPLTLSRSPIEADFPSPVSFIRTDEDGTTTWEGSLRSKSLVDKIQGEDLPETLSGPLSPDFVDPVTWMLTHDYSLEDVAYNSDGHLVGATMRVLVEKMTPHDSLVDPAFSAVFFLTFRLICSPVELVDALIERYNLAPPSGLSSEDLQLWQQRKGIPVRLRVSNFIKIWVETYWRPVIDDPALPTLTTFTRDGLGPLFPGPAQRILELITLRRQSTDSTISPKGDRTRDPGMSINPPSAILLTSEVPRPTMTKTLLVSLRKKDFSNITVTDFDTVELSRQLTIMECNLYCAIQPEEILENGCDNGGKPPVNVRAVSSLSTVITGWIAESILNEPDTKKRTGLIKFFIKVAERCSSLNNFSTTRSILAALDSSTISRLYQTWSGLPQKYKTQLDTLRRLADHSRNYHEYRTRLRNTAPPAVPFLGLYLTDVTFCREGNPSHRASPMNPSKQLVNFNKYHKLARIVQDMQRFQVPYNLKAIPEVQEYLTDAFEKCRHHGDLEDLYRRSLLVEPRQPADAPPTSDMRQLFNWAIRSQPQPVNGLTA